MEQKPKKTAKTAAGSSAPRLQQGDRLIGPGVVKRAKRDPAEQRTSAEDTDYKPSEQVFRRRG